MGAFTELSKNIFKDIVAKAIELNYSESNILILSNKELALKEKYPNVYANLLSCKHNRDMRSPFEYAQDLVASWLFEDTLVKLLNDNGINVKLSGADKTRDILPTSKVSASSDTEVTINGVTRKMELMSDYTGYWTRNHKIDLRDDKFQKTKNTNSLFLGISTKDRKYILLDFSKPIQCIYINYHIPYGGKPCYSIIINDWDLKNFSIIDLANNIIELL